MREQPPDPDGREERAFDQAAALAKVDGDEEFLRQLAKLFLGECPRRLSEMETALSGQDARRLGLAAHALKGTAYHFVAEPTATAAQRLETLADGGDLTAAAPAFRDLAREANCLLRQLGELVQQSPGREVVTAS